MPICRAELLVGEGLKVEWIRLGIVVIQNRLGVGQLGAVCCQLGKQVRLAAKPTHDAKSETRCWQHRAFLSSPRAYMRRASLLWQNSSRMSASPCDWNENLT